jgi:DNA ligase-1
MRDFAQLYRQLDATTRSSEKVRTLVDYLRNATEADAAYAIYFLMGEKLRPTLSSRLLRQAAIEAAAIPSWLFEETYQWVGDLAETIACIVPPGLRDDSGGSLREWIEQVLKPLLVDEDGAKHRRLLEAWMRLETHERFVLNKLITGSLRVGVSRSLVIRALSELAGLSTEVIALRLMGQWSPTVENYRCLLQAEDDGSAMHRPYPFCLAHPWNESLANVDLENLDVEWKWDGIRAQLVRRQQQLFLWSRGEELLTGRFPEIEQAAQQLPDGCVLDGEILGWRDQAPLPFLDLQRRIARKKVGPQVMKEVPVIFLAFDLLEWNGRDLRQTPLAARRQQLEQGLPLAELPSLGSSPLRLSPKLTIDDHAALSAAREQARSLGAEGLMLKDRRSHYEAGRIRGVWWKWKRTPSTIDAVLIYAQRGHGRRATLYSDYTFALWDHGQLVPFAKAYSGLSDEEMREVDRFIRANTRDKFGPVRSVTPQLVMELAFEQVQLSKRHKSGIAVRFPRIVRIRRDKTPDQADQLDQLKAKLALDG